MSARSSTVLVLAGGVFLIRFLQKGKLGNAWTAIWSSPPESGGTGSGGSGGGIPPEPGPSPSGSGPAFPNRSLFGIPVPSWLSYGQNYGGTYHAGIVAGDQAELSSVGGGTFFSDFDYGIPQGSAVKLPGGASQRYRTLSSRFVPGVGYIEDFAPLSATGQRLPGVFSFLHLLTDKVTAGSVHHGGEVVGTSGQPLSPAYGSGEHLAVVTDQPGYNFLQSLGWS